MSPDKIFLNVNGKRTSLAKLIANPAAAIDVSVHNCPGFAALPELPAATHVSVENCPGLAALPDLPAATHVWVVNCPGLAALPELPAATHVSVENCPGLAALPELPAATHVSVHNCPGLAALPELPAATHVGVENCPGLVGKDSRGYSFALVRIRGQWRILAGCRNFSLDDARRHWGPRGLSDRPDCLALVEKCADIISQHMAAE